VQVGLGADGAEPAARRDPLPAARGDRAELEVRRDEPAAAHAHDAAVIGDAAREAHAPGARRAYRRARPRAEVDAPVLAGGVPIRAHREAARHLPAQRPPPRGVRDVGRRQDEEDGQEGEAEHGAIVAVRRRGDLVLSQSCDTRASCPA
jgi:hypothetical protein